MCGTEVSVTHGQRSGQTYLPTAQIVSTRYLPPELTMCHKGDHFLSMGCGRWALVSTVAQQNFKKYPVEK